MEINNNFLYFSFKINAISPKKRRSAKDLIHGDLFKRNSV